MRIATASRDDPEDAHTADQVLENLTAALPAVVSRISGQWDNVKSIGIKTSASVMLPIWTSDINSLHAQADEKVMSRAEKAVKRGLVDEDDSDDSVMHNDEDDAPKAKKQKAAAPAAPAAPVKETPSKSTPKKTGTAAKAKSPATKTKTAAVDIPLPPAETAPAPAPAAAQKKVMAGKKAPAAATPKKTSASAKVKQSVVGKKKVAKK